MSINILHWYIAPFVNYCNFLQRTFLRHPAFNTMLAALVFSKMFGDFSYHHRIINSSIMSGMKSTILFMLLIENKQQTLPTTFVKNQRKQEVNFRLQTHWYYFRHLMLAYRKKRCFCQNCTKKLICKAVSPFALFCPFFALLEFPKNDRFIYCQTDVFLKAFSALKRR